MAVSKWFLVVAGFLALTGFGHLSHAETPSSGLNYAKHELELASGEAGNTARLATSQIAGKGSLEAVCESIGADFSLVLRAQNDLQKEGAALNQKIDQLVQEFRDLEWVCEDWVPPKAIKHGDLKTALPMILKFQQDAASLAESIKPDPSDHPSLEHAGNELGMATMDVVDANNKVVGVLAKKNTLEAFCVQTGLLRAGLASAVREVQATPDQWAQKYASEIQGRMDKLAWVCQDKDSATPDGALAHGDVYSAYFQVQLLGADAGILQSRLSHLGSSKGQ